MVFWIQFMILKFILLDGKVKVMEVYLILLFKLQRILLRQI